MPRQGQTRIPRRSRPLGAGQGPSGGAGGPGRSGGPVYRLGTGHAGTTHLPETPTAETTTAASQSVLLAVGGLLLAGAAIVLAVFGLGSLGPLGRVGMLTLATVILLMLPMMLVRRRLTATAETIAAVGLLMVLLDGYVIWSSGLLRTTFISTPVYFGLVCLATAVIANAYRGASHLVAPRYATVLVLQPVLPLLGYDLIGGPAGWALTFTGVAALDLALGISLTRPGRFAALAGFVRPVHLHLGLPGQHPPPPPPAEPTVEPEGPPMRPESAPEEPDDVKMAADVPVTAAPVIVAPAPPPPKPPAILRDLTWVLFTIAFGAALAYSTVALATTTSLPPTVRAALVLLLAASLGVAGALSWRRYPLPDVAGGLATLAVVVSVVRVGATALPGHTLLFAALAVAVAAVVVPMLPDQARQGPRLASSAAAAGTAAYLIWLAVPAIAGPVSAARPWWHADLPGYAGRVGAAAGPASWQLVIAGALLTLAVALALPGWIRVYAVLAGGVLTMLTVPAALHLDWMVTPALLALVAIGVGAAGLTALDERSASGYVAAAGVLGGYASLTSLTHPAVTSLTLAAITIGGYMIAMLRPIRTDPAREMVGQLVGGWAGGGAAFALPGAVCAGLAALIREDVFPGATAAFVLAGGFVAVSGTLGYAAVRLLASRRQSRPLLLGTTLGALVVAISALVAHSHGATIIDMAVGLLLLASSIVLWLAPSMSSRVILGQELTGNDIAAGAVAASATAALSRVLALLVPGIGLVTTAILVLIVAIATRALPEEQRRGPIAGEMLIGIVIAGAGGVAALGNAVGVVHAANPFWHADISGKWIEHASQYSMYGWQAPMTLLLVAAAAVTVVPRPLGDDIAAVAIGLAALGAPVGFHLSWWSPMVIGILTIIGLGVGAGAADVPRTGYTRIGVAGVVAFFTAAASLVRPSVTSATLESLAIASTLIAELAGIRLAAARTTEARAARLHLVPIGGGASPSS